MQDKVQHIGIPRSVISHTIDNSDGKDRKLEGPPKRIEIGTPRRKSDRGVYDVKLCCAGVLCRCAVQLEGRESGKR